MKLPNPLDSMRAKLKPLSLAAALGAAVFFACGSSSQAALTWNVPGDGTWDTTSDNWTGGGTKFISDGTQDVIFTTGTAGHSITLSPAMSPASTTVSGDYNFTGWPSGGISSGSLTKSGGGTLNLQIDPANFSSIAVTGGTLYTAGYIVAANGAQFNMGTGDVTVNSGATLMGERSNMAGNLVMNGGTWFDNNGFAGSWTGPVYLAADSFFGQNGWCMNQTINGEISGPGGLTWLGGDYNAMLTLNGANTYTGKTIVKKSLLRAGALGYPAGLSNAGLAGALGAPTGDNAIIDIYAGGGLYVGDSNPRMDQSTDRTINLAGSSGTVSINVNDNDTAFTFGAVTATGTGAKTLALHTGAGGNGDREELTFTGAIPDAEDTSPLSLHVTFATQSGSSSYVNLSAGGTFTGPIALVKGDSVEHGYLSIGGRLNNGGNTRGTATLGGGTYAGDIALDANTILNYDSTAAQTLSGTISGPGVLAMSGSNTLTLSGLNSYGGNTTVNSGTVLLAEGGGLTFVVGNGSSNKITGGGSATLNGSFTIDTSAVTTPTASWTLVDVASVSYGAGFSVAGFSGPGPVWTKVDGGTTWTFDATSGMLGVSSVATMTSFGISGHAGTINGLTINLVVPFGTDLATLAPDFTFTSGTCNQTSGAPPSPTFAAASTVTYTVTDGAVVQHYVVSVSVLPAGPGGVNGAVLWMDASQLTGLSNGDAVDTWTDLSGNDHTASHSNGSMTYAAGQLNSLPVVQFRGNGQATITGSMNAKEQYIVFRLEGGDWGSVLGSQTRSGYLMNPSGFFWDGNYPSAVKQNDAAVSNPPYQLSNIGTFMILKITGNDNDSSVRSGWALGLQEGWGSLDMDLAEIVAFDHALSGGEEDAVGGYLTAKYNITDSAYPVGPQKNIVSFTFPTLGDATIVGTSIAKGVAIGTVVTALAPTFTLSADATCVPVSGSTHDFTNPVHYLVTASDATTKDYVVTLSFLPAGPGGVIGAVLWMDASQLGGLSNGNSVDTWSDLSGYGHTATRVSGTMTYATGQVNGLPAVQFRSGGYANLTGTLFAKEQYLVLRNPDASSGFTQWGAALGNVTDQCGYMMGNEAGSFWGGNKPEAVSNNGTVVAGSNFTVTNDGVFIVLKIDGTYPNANLRNYSLGNSYGNGSAQYHTTNLDIAEIIAFDHTLSGADENSVGAYLANKYGITTSYVSSGYGTWAGTYAGGQSAEQDYNHDGVANGIAYFMGATGVATNPGVVNGAVTWPHSASATGITYKVLSSANLADWTDVTADASDAGGFLTYTLPTGEPTRFVRLEVLVP